MMVKQLATLSAPGRIHFLPQEVRIAIFKFLFDDLFLERTIVEVKKTAERTHFTFIKKQDKSVFSATMACLDARVVGTSVASAAAEALYCSDIQFAVDAISLSDFFDHCPVSHAILTA